MTRTHLERSRLFLSSQKAQTNWWPYKCIKEMFHHWDQQLWFALYSDVTANFQYRNHFDHLLFNRWHCSISRKLQQLHRPSASPPSSLTTWKVNSVICDKNVVWNDRWQQTHWVWLVWGVWIIIVRYPSILSFSIYSQFCRGADPSML